MSEVLVTGHDGFIGSAIARHLVKQGHTLCTMSARDGGEIWLGEEDTVEVAMAELPSFEAVVHCAASLSMDWCDPAVVRTNCLGVQQLLEIAQRRKASRLVFLSSISVYGSPQYLPVDEDHPLSPGSVYAASKLFGENLFLAAGESNVSSICFRIPSPIGPGMPAKRLLTSWVGKTVRGEAPDVLGKGTKVQHYIDVRDIARAVDLALGAPAVAGVYNLAGREAVSNLELARRCTAVIDPGLEPWFVDRPDPGDSLRFEYETKKVKEALGFEPEFSIEDSIRALAEESEGSTHR